MLSILNETKTKVFQQEQLTVRIFPSIQEMGSDSRKRSRRPNLSLIGKQTGNKYDFRRCPLTK